MAKTGPEALNGFLDRGSTVRGELHFETLLRLDGKLEGKVVSDAHLVVGEGAQVEGEVEVGHATLGGTVRGTVKASQRIEILKGAKVFADLHTPVLTIEEGAHFEGRSFMNAQAHGEKKLSVVQSS
jgi:cytoskeletal protein CcmA (bactofilin family)